MPTHQEGKGYGQDSEQSSATGKKGDSRGGNFKNDPARAAQAGKKGGEQRQGGGKKS